MTRPHKSERIALEFARDDLARVWLIGAGAIFGLLVVQSILGHYKGQLQEVWSWFVPTIVPTVSLMLCVLGAGALTEQTDRRSVRRSFYGISKSLALFYLITLGGTILLQPLSGQSPVQLYTFSNYWLGPLQGVIVAVLGVLFTSQDKPVAIASPVDGADAVANPEETVVSATASTSPGPSAGTAGTSSQAL